MTELTPRATAAVRRLCRSSEVLIGVILVLRAVQRTGRRSRAWSPLQAVHDVLDPGVVLEPVDRQVLAVPGVLESAVRHLRDQRDVAVDPDAAEVEPLGHPHGPAVVTGPHRGGETVLDAVGPAHRLVLV